MVINMFNKKMVFGLLFLFSSNIFFCMRPRRFGPGSGGKPVANCFYMYRLRERVCPRRTFGRPLAFFDGKLKISAPVSRSTSSFLSRKPVFRAHRMAEKNRTSPAIVRLFSKIRPQVCNLPEVKHIADHYTEGNHFLHLDSLRKRIAKKCESLIEAERLDREKLKYFSITELEAVVECLRKEYGVADKNDTRLWFDRDTKEQSYNDTSRIRRQKKKKKLEDLCKADLEYSLSRAYLNVIEKDLEKANEFLTKAKMVKETNAKNLKRSIVSYREIKEENGAKETLSFSEVLHEVAARERVSAAERVTMQAIEEQRVDREFDISGLTPEFLAVHGYEPEMLEVLSDSTDLQHVIQQEGIYHIVQSQLFHEKYGDVVVLKSLITKHEEGTKQLLIYNKRNQVDKAIPLSDTIWKVGEAIENIGSVFLDGIDALDEVADRFAIPVLKTFGRDLVSRPGAHALALAGGAVEGVKTFVAAAASPVQTAKQAFWGAVNLLGKTADLLDDCIDLCIEAAENPERARAKIDGWKEGALVKVDGLVDQIEDMDQTKITAAIGEYVTAGILTHQSFKLLSKLSGIVKTKFLEVIKKIRHADTVVEGSVDLVGAERTAEGLVKPLGKGSTGRFLPKTLEEQLAMKEVMSNPFPGPDGGRILDGVTMSDATHGWLAEDGWMKMQKIVKYVNRSGKQVKIKIHYVWNKITNQFDDFKFIDEKIKRSL